MGMVDRILHRRRGRIAVVVAAWSIVTAGALVASSLHTPNALSAATVDGCQTIADLSISESQQFTPHADRLSHVPEFAINPDGSPLVSSGSLRPATLDGLPIAWAGAASGAYAETFYLNGAITPTMTRPELFEAGGLIELTYPDDPLAGPYVANLQAELGDRVTVVKVGQFDAALTWGDPMSNGVRPHELSWSSGGTVHALLGVRSPEALVNLALGTVC